MTPPKPVPRPDNVSVWQYIRLFSKDILSAQPARLYRAKMAEFRTPFFASYLVNQPDLIREVLEIRPQDFPKSDRVRFGLAPLLGRSSVFLTNGQTWARQRRIIDPAFERGRIKDSFAAMVAAVQDARDQLAPGAFEAERMTSHLAADIIFRTLFSIPITDTIATEVFDQFRAYQISAPILNMGAFVPALGWLGGLRRPKARRAARRLRQLISGLVERRLADMAAGHAPDDLATRILSERDPQSGRGFDRAEMIDQVAIFFLAGHETSAAALAWALYLLATHSDAQERVAQEAADLPANPGFADLASLAFTRNVFRETLRLYPPVPMMVRQCTAPETFRDRRLAKGAQIVISPWHLHRHQNWTKPDEFDPDRFDTNAGRASMRDGFLPFSKGERVCAGAGFAMAEGVLTLALLVAKFRFSADPARVPQPRAHLTVRAANGIHLTADAR